MEKTNVMHKNFWRAAEDSWNVKRAEESIVSVKQFANHLCGENPSLGTFTLDTMIPQLTAGRPWLTPLMKDAVVEMADIMNGTAANIPFRINHIKSGKSVYTVFINNGKSYSYGGAFTSEEAAKAEAEKHEDAYYEKEDGENNWNVWVLDEEDTKHLREQQIGGEYVGEFDTVEEAQEEAAHFDDAFVTEYDSEEWFAVINTTTGKNEFNMLFPSQVRALAFLYDTAKPPAWMAYTDRLYGEVQ